MKGLNHSRTGHSVTSSDMANATRCNVMLVLIFLVIVAVIVAVVVRISTKSHWVRRIALPHKLAIFGSTLGALYLTTNQ
jgi:hypothetical protein